jgi:hypothetical protein
MGGLPPPVRQRLCSPRRRLRSQALRPRSPCRSPHRSSRSLASGAWPGSTGKTSTSPTDSPFAAARRSYGGNRAAPVSRAATGSKAPQSRLGRRLAHPRPVRCQRRCARLACRRASMRSRARSMRQPSSSAPRRMGLRYQAAVTACCSSRNSSRRRVAAHGRAVQLISCRGGPAPNGAAPRGAPALRKHAFLRAGRRRGDRTAAQWAAGVRFRLAPSSVSFAKHGRTRQGHGRCMIAQSIVAAEYCEGVKLVAAPGRALR